MTTVPEIPPGVVEPLEPIAIIGMAARVPGARDLNEFWRNLLDGTESITRFSREEQLARGVGQSDLDDPSWVGAAPVLEQHDAFDAALFGMTDHEAALTDPQHRLFLEVVHTALEDSGYDSARTQARIGVYGGSGGNSYHWVNLAANPEVWEMEQGSLALAVGNSPSYLCTTLSYKLDLRGPSMTVQTACSTSMVAIHLACEALRNGECEMALAGGVSIELPQGVGYAGSDGFLSADGHCRPFDAAATGTLWGSGAGAVVLKRLSAALADGDSVRAVILGNAVNNDGATKVGFSAPSVTGQVEVITQALAAGGVDPRTVGYVEAHGTGTALGDPIEVAALSRVYGRDTQENGWCGVGSVKSNIGHLSQAAGVIGVIKCALALEHGLIPPTVNFTEPNPAIDFDRTPFHVVTSMSKWHGDGGPRRAGVSSFGIGGTNAHLIMQEPPRPVPVAAPQRGHYALRLSAASPKALLEARQQLAGHLEGAGASGNLADVAYTLGAGRAEHEHRSFVLATDPADAVAALKDGKRVRSGHAASAPRVAFLFSGQGAQYAGMGAELYRAVPGFAAAVDECAELLLPHLDGDIRQIMFETGADAEERLRQTRFSQPALFTLEYALAQAWRDWGVSPWASIGHSIGEYVAATQAGVFELDGALRLVAARGRLMQELPGGTMLAIQLDESETAALLPEGVSIATINGPGACVVAGPAEAVAAFGETLKARRVGSRPLRTSHAFHSAMMEPILPAFTELVAGVTRHRPSERFISNVTGDWITPDQAVDPHYWAEHLRRPVRFGAGLATLTGAGAGILLECGPGRQLAGLARLQTRQPAQQAQAVAPAPPLHSLPGPGERAGDLETALAAAGAMWVAGVRLDPETLDAPGRRVHLPTYPYQRRRHWIEPAEKRAEKPKQDKDLELADWFAVPLWRQAGGGPAPAPGTEFVVVTGGARGDAVAEALRQAGAKVIEVRAGEPVEFAALPSTSVHFVHASTLDADDPARAQELGYFSALRLVQAIAAADRAGSARLTLLTGGTEDVLGGDVTAPEHATMAGLARVVPLELPGLVTRRIDVDPGVRAKDIVAELCRGAEGAQAEVALRGNRRWVKEFEQIHLAPVSDTVLRPHGRYLITGGLGGVGITLAEELGTRLRARLILVSRTGTAVAGGGGDARQHRAQEAIARIEAAGGEVLVVAADVTSAASLAEARAAAVERFGGIDGIVHAAGLAGGAMIEVADPAVSGQVFAPKVQGTVALHQVFGDLRLDFVALCSSVTGVAGGLGQVDYCAANAFMDAFARSGRWDAPVVSMNWGGWLEVGMAVETRAPAALRALKRGDQRSLAHPMLSSGDGTVWHGQLSATTHWLLGEHRVGGVPVVPGTAHLEAALAAVRESVPAPAPGSALELRDVVFLKPFSVAEGTVAGLAVEVTQADGELGFRIFAPGGDTFVQGAAAWTGEQPSAVDVRVLRAAMRPVTVAPRGHSGVVQLGPRWNALEAHYAGADEEVAVISGPAEVAAELEAWTLHPALLDVATSFGTSRGEGQYLPLSYGRIRVHRGLPARFLSHLRYRASESAGDEVVAADLTLCAEDGTVLAEIEDFVLRRIDGASVAAGVAGTGARQRPGSTGGIRPADGAEAFRRAIEATAGAGLGAQIVINPRSVESLLESVRRNDIRAVEAATPSGQAPGAAHPGGGRAEGHLAPRSELEKVIAQVWSQILGVPEISVDDDFFSLGGNSLVAVQLISQTRKATGIRIPMRSLFSAPTVAQLAAVAEQIRDAGPGQHGPAHPPAQETPTTIPVLPR